MLVAGFGFLFCIHLNGRDDTIAICVDIGEHALSASCVLGARDLPITVGVHLFEFLIRVLRERHRDETQRESTGEEACVSFHAFHGIWVWADWNVVAELD